MTTDNDKSSMEVMARLTGVKIELREVVDNWLLLTYDMLHSEEGDKARSEFLTDAREIGAAQQTESVYLIPWSPEAELLALNLSRQVQDMKRGRVIIWTAKPTDKDLLKGITETYDAGLGPALDDVSERLDRIEEHLTNNRNLRAEGMLKKTKFMLDNLEASILRRGSANLFIRLQLLQRRYKNVS